MWNERLCLRHVYGDKGQYLLKICTVMIRNDESTNSNINLLILKEQ
jgi:hypothetical protein